MQLTKLHISRKKKLQLGLRKKNSAICLIRKIKTDSLRKKSNLVK